MPIKIDNALPAKKILESENIFVMDEERATSQDIRPLKLVIFNLMPTKIETETQLLRLLGNTPLQVEIDLLQSGTHISKNTSAEHLLNFYKTFDDIKDNKYDGMIITGAPVEQLAFEDVDYWDELCKIMDWSETNVYSTFHICWGAQAGLYHRYGIKKYPLDGKMFGVFEHRCLIPNHPLLRGFSDTFFAPHSRHTEVLREDIEKVSELDILSVSDDAGIYIVADHDCRNFYIMGHAEYDRDTLAREFHRDWNRGAKIDMPYNYFPGNDPRKRPAWTWRAHANLMFINWINYFVYQRTPYDISKIGEE